jgi:RNA polymerase sigma factor (sigma-70 family)
LACKSVGTFSNLSEPSFTKVSVTGTESSVSATATRRVHFSGRTVRNPDLAENLVQETLLKALKADRKPFEKDDVISWFYRILRRSIIDLCRRQGARDRALEKVKAELPVQPDAQPAFSFSRSTVTAGLGRRTC